jgi:dienelactone hydrolase
MTITQNLLSIEQGNLPLTIAQAGGTGAAVVIFPSAFGVGSDLQAQMEELAADARLVVAIDPFFREDPGPVPYDDTAKVMTRLRAIDRDRGDRDFRVAIDWARSRQDVRAVVALGICFGGPFALRAAADGAVDGVVTWHGTRMDHHLERTSEMRCPMRLHFGSVDPVVPAEAVETVRRAFAGRHDVRVIVHEGATHGFSHRAAPRAYNERAERAGMDSLRELLTGVSR